MMYVLENAQWFLLLIVALVFFHELGHFLVAKACGVRVLRFSLGFGPRLLSFTRGDTEYTLSLLPLGGYVKMLGESVEAPVEPQELGFSFAHKPLWQRTAIVLAGPVANFILAWVTYFCMFVGPHEFGDTRLGFVARGEAAWQAGIRAGDKITVIENRSVHRWEELREAIADNPNALLHVTYERAGVLHNTTLMTQTRAEKNAFAELEQRGKIGVSLQYLRPVLAVIDPQSPAAVAGLRTDDVILAVAGHNVQAWHEVREYVANVKPHEPIVLQVQRGGSSKFEVKLPALAPWPQDLPRDLLGSADVATDSANNGYTGLVNKDSLVVVVQPDTPAAKAGMLPGDRLLALRSRNTNGEVNDRPLEIWSLAWTTLSAADTAPDLTLIWQRGHAVMQQQVQLVAKTSQDELKTPQQVYVLGADNDPTVLDSYSFTERVGPWVSLCESSKQVLQDSTLIGQGLVRLFTGRVPLDNMGGPIMLFVLAEKSAKRGTDSFLQTMAVISVNLGMLNLLPVPMLDGGHLLFFAIEALMGRVPSVKVREWAQMVGMVLLLMLMVLAFHNDILRFILK